MASSNVRRKMSYRKPVPQYVPTPPGSPAPATLPPVELELLQVTDDLLSLPPTWGTSQKPSYPSHQGQFLVTSMFTHAPAARTMTSRTDERASPPHASLFVQGSSSQDSLSREPSQGGDHEVDESGIDRKRRKLHREFRPPTPPLPAQHKRRRLTVSAYPDENEVSQGEASINRDLQQVNNVVDDREQGGSRSLWPTPSFTTERTFVSLGAAPQPMGDTSMASGWSGGLTTFVSESDPRLTHYPLPLYNPASMRIPDSKIESEKTRYHAPTRPSWLCGTLASCRAGLQKFCVMFCC